jgi:hypothetical protein
MDQILIRRCNLTITRRGGWSWGGDRRQLAASAVDALKQILIDRLRYIQTPADGVAEPSATTSAAAIDKLRVSVSLSHRDFCALTHGALISDQRPYQQLAQAWI